MIALKSIPKNLLRLLAIVLCLTLVSGCGKAEVAPEETATLRALGNSFVTKLQNDILPLRETPEAIPMLGYVLEKGDKTYGADNLYTAYGKFKTGEDCDTVIVFANESFVASNIVFLGGQGYYFRYEYDAFHPGEVTVSGRTVDDMKLAFTEIPSKAELRLFRNKRELVTLTLRNPAETSGEE